MDGSRFDQLARGLWESGSRRGVLLRLSAVPVLGGLAGLLAVDEDEADAKKKKNKNKKKNKCKKAKVCAGKCGTVSCTKRKKNGKKQRVQHDCGPCVCEPACEPTECCDQGTCVAECPAGQACIGGTCGVAECDVCETGCAFTSIQDAIDDPSLLTTIRVCEGVYDEDLTIGRDLTIVGSGQGSGPNNNTIIHGLGNTSAVIVTAGTVTLERLRITGGGGDSGAGVFNTAGANLTLDRCTIADNVVLFGNGGGVANESGATLTMTNCTVTSNDNVNGRGIGAHNAGTMTVTDCTFTANGVNSDFAEGGGLYNAGGATLTITGSTFEGNEARHGGGFYDNGGTVEISDTDFTGNIATNEGGAIRVDGGTVTLTDCTISDNEAEDGGGIWNDFGSTLTLVNTIVVDNTAGDEGGGIVNTGALLNLTDGSSVAGNTAANVAGKGGGIFQQQDATVSCETAGMVTGNTPDQCVEQTAGSTGCASCI